MRRVGLDDLTGPGRYAQMRSDIRRRIIEIKRYRRVGLGDKITLVFENFDTVLFQTQEMLHVEQIRDLDRIREELAVYNDLLPEPDELSATLLIEIVESDRVASELHALLGIEETLVMIVDGQRFPARFEEGRSNQEKLSAVQYVRFPLSSGAAERFRNGAPVAIEIHHPNYEARTELSEEQRAALAEDLAP